MSVGCELFAITLSVEARKDEGFFDRVSRYHILTNASESWRRLMPDIFRFVELTFKCD